MAQSKGDIYANFDLRSILVSQISVYKPLKSIHIRLGLKNVSIVRGGILISIILRREGVVIELRIYTRIDSEGIGLTNRALARDSTVDEEGSEVSGEKIGMIAVCR